MLSKVQKRPEMMNLLKHKLLQDQVLMLPVEFDNADIVVDSRQYEDKAEWGLVVSKGKGRILENGEVVDAGVEPGDLVLFMSYGGTKQRALGQDFVYVRQEDIVSVYSE